MTYETVAGVTPALRAISAAVIRGVRPFSGFEFNACYPTGPLATVHKTLRWRLRLSNDK
jgi:hypothetical protein